MNWSDGHAFSLYHRSRARVTGKLDDVLASALVLTGIWGMSRLGSPGLTTCRFEKNGASIHCGIFLSVS
jgi:hypothetical protein